MREKQQMLMELGAMLDRFLVRAVGGDRHAWEMCGLLERTIQEVRNA